jgi:hypothetical protein
MMRTIVILVCLFGAVRVLPAANILPNSSFESWLFGIPVGWLTSQLLYPGSAVQDTISNTGVYSVKLTGTDTAAFVTTAVAVTPGRSYFFSGYALVPGALGGSFAFLFLSARGDTLGNPVLLPVYYSGSEYREYTTWVTAPDSAAGIVVGFATLIGLEANVDDVTLDDTTSGGVMDSPRFARPAGPCSRKVLSVAGSSDFGPAPADFHDALGRRLAGRPRSGVYFVVPER